MAIQRCERCGTVYEDIDHMTTCPHEYFEMRCLVVRSDGTEKFCTTPEQLRQFLDEGREAI